MDAVATVVVPVVRLEAIINTDGARKKFPGINNSPPGSSWHQPTDYKGH